MTRIARTLAAIAIAVSALSFAAPSAYADEQVPEVDSPRRQELCWYLWWAGSYHEVCVPMLIDIPIG